MPLHVFCYLGQNERNKHNKEDVNHLAITKWLTKTTAHPRQAYINSPFELEGKKPRSVFSRVLERSFFVCLFVCFFVYSITSDHSLSTHSHSRRDQDNARIKGYVECEFQQARSFP